MTASPTALPIARLRALGCMVSTTYSHGPRFSSPTWAYLVTPTGPSAPDVCADARLAGLRVDARWAGSVLVQGITAHDTAAELDKLADIVADEQDVTTPTGSDACERLVATIVNPPGGDTATTPAGQTTVTIDGVTVTVCRSQVKPGRIVVEIDTDGDDHLDVPELLAVAVNDDYVFGGPVDPTEAGDVTTPTGSGSPADEDEDYEPCEDCNGIDKHLRGCVYLDAYAGNAEDRAQLRAHQP